MNAAEQAGYAKLTVAIFNATSLEAAFNVNGNLWDSRNGLNYQIPFGIHTVENGKVTPGTPGPSSTPVPDTQPPTVPTNLQISSKTSTSVSLSWSAATDNVGVARYEIYRNGSKYVDASATTIMINDLTADTNYSFSVRAADAVGNISAESNVVQVKTNPPNTSNAVTVYYKRKVATGTQYMHYRPVGGTWTAVPGTAMTNGQNGYAFVTVGIGAATGLEAVFNVNGANWDNNNSRNYSISSGIVTLENGVIRSGAPY